MNTVLIEDEADALNRLEQLLLKHFPDITISGTASTPLDAVRLIEHAKPDIVFLDIELERGSGFQVIEQIKEPDFALIITTAHSHYATKAFRYAALDFLVKPIQLDEFLEAIDRATNHHLPQLKERLATLSDHLSGTKSRLAVPDTNGLLFVDIPEIIRIESDKSYTTMHLHDGQKMVNCTPLIDFEKLLQEFSFMRVHQSHLVNLNFVKGFKRLDGGVLNMTDQSEVPVSRRRKTELQERLSALSYRI